jgi:ATP-binding cassette subfamily F protein 3
LVSHDRYLLEACVDRLWSVEHGGVQPYDGDLNDYRRLILSDRRGNAKNSKNGGKNKQTEAPVDRAEARRASAQKRSEVAELRKRIATTESATKRLAAEVEKLDAALAEPGLFARDAAKAAALGKSRADAAVRLKKAEDDWLAASAEYEAAMA